jgi:DNA modification methylase/superfamily II DNA or RNA helicase
MSGESKLRYDQFLRSKSVVRETQGLSPKEPHKILFPFQRDIVKWALRRGRACIFADCGMGKTFIQIEWARQIPGNVLILAPLAVANQTIAEAAKLDCFVRYCRHQREVKKGITVTNYEMLEQFDPSKFKGIVLDESSIIKHFEGKFRNAIISGFSEAPYRLACTATPAPNDHMELGNHAEFVGAMSRTEMLSMFFVHDGGETSKWRLKGHAEQEFWKWVCSWAVMIRKPSDLGYEDGGFILPPMVIEQISVEHQNSGDFLFAMEAQTLQERMAARRESISDRVRKCAELVNASSEPWLIWCNLNSESDELESEIEDAVQVQGSEKMESKLQKLTDFTNGKIRVMVTKPSIAGHGMNWQHCRKVAFVGLSDSWEQYYQAVRRCWRFGQNREVHVYIITSTAEGAVVTNIKRKEADASRMALEMVKHMHSINEANIKGTAKTADAYVEDVARGDNYELHLGDCIEVLKKIETESIGFSIFSPPFASLYTYSASDRDLGNVKTDAEFHKHFAFVIAELFRVLQPGRLVSFHCMDIPSMKSRDGMIGLKDFPAQLIESFRKVGFIYHSRVVIWKDPLIEATRTKALGLMHKQIQKDSSMCRQGLPDYLITMRKPGESKPIAHPDGFTRFIGLDEPNARKGKPKIKYGDFENGDHKASTNDDPVYSHQVWRRYASPVWMDIDQTRTLQRESAREEKDERHICPLQLDVIERAMELWSNPGDTVLSPFAGIGSEGFVALSMGRKFIGIELKASYWKQAAANLALAESESAHDLFAKTA